jgi:glycine/D-amino acid oxidase-like deaminating enzyme
VDSSLAERIVMAVERSGSSLVVEGAEVVRVRADGDHCVLDVHDGRRVIARDVVVCIGPWLARGIEGLGGGPPVRVKKVVAALLPTAPPPDASHIYLFDHEAFLLPQPERNRWLMSFRSDDWDCAPSLGELRVDQDDWEKVRRLLALHLPGTEWAGIGVRAFCDGYTDSREPVIYRDPALPHCVVLGGCSGSGVRMAPGMAERAIALLEERPAP